MDIRTTLIQTRPEETRFCTIDQCGFVMSRQYIPVHGCKATKEGLMESKHKLNKTDDCPNCLKLNVLCFVSNHPARTGKMLLWSSFPPSPFCCLSLCWLTRSEVPNIGFSTLITPLILIPPWNLIVFILFLIFHAYFLNSCASCRFVSVLVLLLRWNLSNAHSFRFLLMYWWTKL